MKPLIAVIILSALSVSTAKIGSVQNFIIDYLHCRNVYAATLLTCWNRQEAFQTLKALNNANIRANFHTLNFCLEHPCYIRNVTFRTMVILDISCENALRIFTLEYKYPNKWMLLDFANSTWTSNWGEHVNIRMSSDVTLALGSKNKSVTLYDIYDPGLGVRRKIIKYGFWSSSSNNDDCSFISKVSLYERRKDMTGVVVRVAFLVTKNLSTPLRKYLKETKNRHQDSISKFNYELFAHVIDKHKFIARLLTTDQWFGKTSKGNDAGIVKLLDMGKADVGCCAAMTDSNKIAVVDFIVPTYPLRMQFMFRNPRLHSGIRNEILKPFTFEAWCVTLVFILILTAVLKLIYTFERLMHKTRLYLSTMTVFLLTISALCQQGLFVLPLHGAGRITVLTLLLCSLLVYNFYTSSIVSSLLIDVPSPFKNIREFAQSDLEMGLERLGYLATFLDNVNDSDIRFLYKMKLTPKHGAGARFYTQEQGIEKVRQGGFAYHTEATTAYSLIERTFGPIEICEVEELRMIKPFMLAVMTKKNSEYRKMFQITYVSLKYFC